MSSSLCLGVFVCIFLVSVIVKASRNWSQIPCMHRHLCILVICRWGFGKEQPGPCALWVDPEGPELCGGPRLAWGSYPQKTVRVWHQDTDEDSGAEPPHPVHSKKVSVCEGSLFRLFLNNTPLFRMLSLQFECLYQMMNPAVSHLITPKQINKRCLVFQFGVFCS